MSSSVVTVLSVPAGASLTRGDVDRHRLGRRVEIDAAVGRAAVVLHLEGEAGVGRAVGVGGRREHEQPARDVGDRDELPGRHRHAVVGQRAGGRQRRDLDGQEVVGRAVVRDR